MQLLFVSGMFSIKKVALFRLPEGLMRIRILTLPGGFVIDKSFDIISWLESKIAGKDFTEILKTKTAA